MISSLALFQVHCAIAKQLELNVATDMEEKLKSCNSVDKEHFQILQLGDGKETVPNISGKVQSSSEEHYKYNRGNKGCRTLFVGDHAGYQ